MAIDIIARGLASSILNDKGQIDAGKMPTLNTPTGENIQFNPVGGLVDQSWIEGRTAEEILMAILFGLVNPILIDPSFEIELTSKSTMIANQEGVIEGKLLFNQGEIRAADGSVLPRTGNITQLMVDGRATSELFSISFTPALGRNVIVATVEFAEGLQPVDSLGNPYGVPYPAGSMTASIEILGINNLTTAEGEDIEFEYFEEIDGSGYEAIHATEATGVKQSFVILKDTTIVGIKQFNTLSQQWEWIGGSPEASLATFDIIEQEDKIIYIHNGSIKGERELRLYTFLKE